MTTPARVLVVEDNDFNLDLMNTLLESFGYQALTARNGHEGLALARAERPDLILCDVQMPGMDGIEFVRQAREDVALAGLPIVAVTAYAMVGDRERMLDAGFSGYLPKPIDPMRFGIVLRHFLPPTLQGSAAPIAPAPSPPKVPVVLVLDDSPLNLELKRALLEPLGFQVLTADSMVSALALASARRPDLIISDVGMRLFSGFEFIRRVKADPALRDVPFIFLSSTHVDDEARARGLDLGAVRYLRRPMEPDEMLAEIKECLRTARPRPPVAQGSA